MNRRHDECQDGGAPLERYLDGDLDETEFQAHAAGCAACRREMAAEASLRHAFSSLPQPRLSLAGRERILAAAAAEPEAESSRAIAPRAARLRRALPLRRVLPAAAALAALLVLALPALRPEAPREAPAYTEAEIEAARRQAVLTLARAAEVMNRSERSAVAEVFRRRLPQVIRESLDGSESRKEGGQG